MEGEVVNEPKKNCLYCKKVIDVKEWVEKVEQKQPGGKLHRNSVRFVLGLWTKKTFCNKKCGKNFRSSMFKHCVHCGKKFNRNNNESTPTWYKRTYCGRGCAVESYHIKCVAKAMGLTHEQLKPELVKIAEKYAK